jgi:hypothetical protein
LPRGDSRSWLELNPSAMEYTKQIRHPDVSGDGGFASVKSRAAAARVAYCPSAAWVSPIISE